MGTIPSALTGPQRGPVLRDLGRGVGEVALRFPSGILQAIARPINQVLEATPTVAVAKDGLHLLLRLPLNHDRVRGLLPTCIT